MLWSQKVIKINILLQQHLQIRARSCQGGATVGISAVEKLLQHKTVVKVMWLPKAETGLLNTSHANEIWSYVAGGSPGLVMKSSVIFFFAFKKLN